MPFLTAPFLRHLVQVGREVDVAIPRTADGYQPLCACYGSGCAPAIRRSIKGNALKVTDLLAKVSVHEIGPEELEPFDPDGRLFFNINTPDDYERCLALTAGRRR